MNIPLIIVLLYIAVLFLISFWAEKRARGGWKTMFWRAEN